MIAQGYIYLNFVFAKINIAFQIIFVKQCKRRFKSPQIYKTKVVKL